VQGAVRPSLAGMAGPVPAESGKRVLGVVGQAW
jgi:hypothetical protein